MPSPSAFAPLRHPAFRALWIANLASNTGMWIQNTGAGWLMTSLAPSPLMVGLVQAAAMLPVFLFALPGGAAADILDRRLALVAAQLWIAAMGVLLAVLAAADALGPWGLLALTFAIGAGTAVNFPAWAAATPELVPREDLVGAIALNGHEADDGSQVGPLLDRVDGPAASFTADGAFDRDDVYGEVTARHPHATIIVPPRSGAVPSDTAAAAPTQRDRHIEAIAEHGRVGWQKASGYNWRALVEADTARFKRMIGDALRSQTGGRQAAEVAIAVQVLNRMLDLGRPEYVRLA
jgi:hypothetical protein